MYLFPDLERRTFVRRNGDNQRPENPLASHLDLALRPVRVESKRRDQNYVTIEHILHAVTREQDGKVTAEYSRGYKFGSQLLRPAKVQVGRGRAQSAGE
ncbi:MAG: nucleotide exchange factor GrpE [Pyrinomonadaceae bacterium]